MEQIYQLDSPLLYAWIVWYQCSLIFTSYLADTSWGPGLCDLGSWSFGRALNSCRSQGTQLLELVTHSGFLRSPHLGRCTTYVELCMIHVLHVHTCSYMFIHVHTCSYMFIHVHTCSYMFIHVHTCSYMFIFPATSLWYSPISFRVYWSST